VSSFPATATLTINGTSFNAGSYSLDISGTSGSTTHSLTVPFQVGDYSISGTQTLPLAPGGQGTASLKLNSSIAGRSMPPAMPLHSPEPCARSLRRTLLL
jgi:hypothetical protein